MQDPSVGQAFWGFLANDELPETQARARGLAAVWLADHPPLPAGLLLPDLADPAGWARQALAWRATEISRAAVQLSALTEQALSLALTQMIPALAVDGAWLQYASNPLNSHTALASALLRIHCRRRAVMEPIAAAMRRALGLPKSSTWEFADHRDLRPEAFALPALQLALAQQPRGRMPELLGVTLFAAFAAPDPLLCAVAGRHGAFPALPDLSVDEEMTAALDAVALAGIRDDEKALPRLQHGFAAAASLQCLAREMAVLLAANQGPAARMAVLLRRKASVAQGYHNRVHVNGRALDTLFAAGDPVAMLGALAASDYIVAGDPANSPLLKEATDPRGAMAGVFDEDEIATIAAWITSLPALDVDPPPSPLSPRLRVGDAEPPHVASHSDSAWGERPLRELYHALLHIEDHPDLVPFARSFAALWLARAGAGQEKPGPRSLPFVRYEHSALEAWLHAQHRAQLADYAEGRAAAASAPPTREEVIEDAVQLCPMVLIDGAWLHRTGQVAFAATPVGARLFRIWRDEVGNGVVRENHPNVHRELLAEMGVELPPFGTPEFARWPRFRDGAFAVPVFWLCISRFPRQFLSELLGLNLAMELSGVGGSYRSASDALRAHGFTPTFVELHNTVDNVSTGHTAMAAAAIRLHLDDALAFGGAEEVQRRWKRVWTGYRALVPPPGFNA